jgi:hypothetical protein
MTMCKCGRVAISGSKYEYVTNMRHSIEECKLSFTITPNQLIVERIAKLVGGPADGNLVAHVQAIVIERDMAMKRLTSLGLDLG